LTYSSTAERLIQPGGLPSNAAHIELHEGVAAKYKLQFEHAPEIATNTNDFGSTLENGATLSGAPPDVIQAGSNAPQQNAPANIPSPAEASVMKQEQAVNAPPGDVVADRVIPAPKTKESVTKMLLKMKFAELLELMQKYGLHDPDEDKDTKTGRAHMRRELVEPVFADEGAEIAPEIGPGPAPAGGPAGGPVVPPGAQAPVGDVRNQQSAEMQAAKPNRLTDVQLKSFLPYFEELGGKMFSLSKSLHDNDSASDLYVKANDLLGYLNTAIENLPIEMLNFMKEPTATKISNMLQSFRGDGSLLSVKNNNPAIRLVGDFLNEVSYKISQASSQNQNIMKLGSFPELTARVVRIALEGSLISEKENTKAFGKLFQAIRAANTNIEGFNASRSRIIKSANQKEIAAQLQSSGIFKEAPVGAVGTYRSPKSSKRLLTVSDRAQQAATAETEQAASDLNTLLEEKAKAAAGGPGAGSSGEDAAHLAAEIERSKAELKERLAGLAEADKKKNEAEEAVDKPGKALMLQLELLPEDSGIFEDYKPNGALSKTLKFLFDSYLFPFFPQHLRTEKQKKEIITRCLAGAKVAGENGEKVHQIKRTIQYMIHKSIVDDASHDHRLQKLQEGLRKVKTAPRLDEVIGVGNFSGVMGGIGKPPSKRRLEKGSDEAKAYMADLRSKRRKVVASK
jgi:hypothetical protein